ncbi:MAG: hypothetical protein ACLUQC_04165 [Lactococcus raffinolactis]|uniref:hypothetical protein n=1 Tax=Pseudolactococcus raffinolactis TaxID=1366 RepID=UPI0039963264
MEINVYEMIEDDKFFIGSYPDSFSVGRWFTVDELVNSSYEKIEQEYLTKYNPYARVELELAVFDVDNVSGLWSGEYDVSSLIDKLREIVETEYYEIRLEVYDFDDDFFEETGMSKVDIARAVFFGNIKNWLAPYIGYNGSGNFETYSETERQARIDMYVKDLGLF